MRRFVGVIVVAVLAGAGSWFFGVGVLPAVVIALAIGSIGVVLRVVTGATPSLDWPLPPPAPSDGKRRETSELSWAIRARGGAVDDRIVLRIRGIAENRLALRQLDLENPAHRPAIQKLVGAQTYDILANTGGRRVRVPDMLVVLDILDSLHRPQTQPRSTTTHRDTNSEKQA